MFYPPSPQKEGAQIQFSNFSDRSNHIRKLEKRIGSITKTSSPYVQCRIYCSILLSITVKTVVKIKKDSHIFLVRFLELIKLVI